MMQRPSWIMAALLAPLWLAGCAAQPARPAADASQPAAEISPADLPNADLTPDLLADLLTGEIALQRGHLDIALGFYTRVAFETRDPRTAARATRLALYARQFGTALDMARLWHEFAPDDPVAGQALAQALVLLGRPDEALRQFEAMIAAAGDAQGDVLQQIGEMVGRSDKPAMFMPVMDKLVAQHADSASAYFARAFVASRLADYAAVERDLSQALRLRPAWQDAAVARLANLAMLKDYAALDSFARDFLRRNPGANRIRDVYARSLVGRNELDAALAEFRQVIRRDAGDSDAVYAAGLVSLQLHHWQQAGDYLQRYLKLQPNDSQARLYLGDAAAGRGDFATALNWYQQIHDPRYRLAAALRSATALSHMGKIDQALSLLNGLSPASDADRVQVALARSQAYRDADRLTEAKAVLDAALKTDADNGNLLYSRGLVEAELKEVAAHERDMRKLIALEPDNAQAYNALGYTLADQTDRYQEARTLIARALQLQPDDPFILDSMGWVQFRLGNARPAIDYLQRAFDLRNDPEIAAHLGEVLWVNGEQRAARKIWAKGLREEPDNAVLRETIDRLKR